MLQYKNMLKWVRVRVIYIFLELNIVAVVIAFKKNYVSDSWLDIWKFERIVCLNYSWDCFFSWWQHAGNLASYEQQDAHEFFISMLDGIHEKVEKDERKPHSQGEVSFTSVIIQILLIFVCSIKTWKEGWFSIWYIK